MTNNNFQSGEDFFRDLGVSAKKIKRKVITQVLNEVYRNAKKNFKKIGIKHPSHFYDGIKKKVFNKGKLKGSGGGIVLVMKAKDKGGLLRVYEGNKQVTRYTKGPNSKKGTSRKAHSTGYIKLSPNFFENTINEYPKDTITERLDFYLQREINKLSK